jgi:formate hydrogenlyase subunit 3/multisubunit Na+/H+ antiporter MnhD subunit
MYKVARLGEKQLNRKPNTIFALSCILLFICMIICFLLVAKTFENSEIMRFLISKGDNLENIFVGLIVVCWIYCSFYSMIMSFKTEESINEEFIPTLQDKTFRFFQILYWVFGLWIVQPKINELEIKIKQSGSKTS